jgi:hypothetical protein
VSSDALPPPGWHADPWGRYRVRYWDGRVWTDHVADDHGTQLTDTVPAGASQIGPGDAGDVHPLLDASLLVVHRSPRAGDGDDEFGVYDGAGSQVGAIRRVRQSAARRAMRVFTSADSFVTQRLDIIDMSGALLMQLTRPATLVRSQIVVADERGRPLGTVQQENVFGTSRFACMVGDVRVGGIDPRRDEWDVAFTDDKGEEVAHVSRSFDHVVSALLGPEDDFVIEVRRRVEDPLRRLVLASALGYDIALRPGDE